jgi:hypothetical protein
MFPDPKDIPADTRKLGVRLAVPLDVSVEFRPPPVSIIVWRESVVRAAVPEAAVDHHGKAGLPE